MYETNKHLFGLVLRKRTAVANRYTARRVCAAPQAGPAHGGQQAALPASSRYRQYIRVAHGQQTARVARVRVGDA